MVESLRERSAARVESVRGGSLGVRSLATRSLAIRARGATANELARALTDVCRSTATPVGIAMANAMHVSSTRSARETVR